MRFYILKDEKIEASTATREEALTLIEIYQAKENHFICKPQFSIIQGEQEYINYKEPKKVRRKKSK